MEIEYKIYVLFERTDYKLGTITVTDYHIHSTYIQKYYAIKMQKTIPNSYIEENRLFWKSNYLDD